MQPSHVPGQSPEPLRFHAYRNEDQWAWAIAVVVAAELRRELEQHDRARLLVSGGTTPAPAFRALSQAPLPWERVEVGLVDERWLLPEDEESNAYLARTQLLRNYARAARLETLTQSGRRIEEAVAVANLHARRRAGIVLLGMGDDGHTASLFPHMRDLELALSSSNAYVPIDASGCPGAGPWPRRISLTPHGLAQAHTRLLLIRGDRKRQVIERALAGNDPAELPVRIAFQTPGAQLQVHWCP
ncbi:MAG: 6-phosphogluconolactonase [Luteimonas sp.]